MTPDQQAALEGLTMGALTESDIAALESPLAVRNDVAIAAILSASLPPVTVSIRVEDVFNIVFETGDYLGLKAAQLQGNALAVMVFSVLEDAKKLGPGLVNLQSPATVTLFDQLQAAGLLSAASRTAFAALASAPATPIGVSAVSDALNLAEGRMTL